MDRGVELRVFREGFPRSFAKAFRKAFRMPFHRGIPAGNLRSEATTETGPIASAPLEPVEQRERTARLIGDATKKRLRPQAIARHATAGVGADSPRGFSARQN